MTFLTGLLYTILTIILSIPTLHLLATLLSLPLLTFAARSIASFFCLILCASYGVIASIALRIVGQGGLSQWTVARAFKWTMYLFTGVTFTIHDPSNSLSTRPAVFIGNHQSELDVLMLGCMFPRYCSVTAKRSLQYVPFLGWFMLLSKTVFINRSSSKEARAAFSNAVKTMREERQSVFIFPEGTRSYATEPRMLPFKKGAFHLAIQAGVPVVPVVVGNYSRLLDVKRKRFGKGSIPISVLPAVSTEGLTGDDVGDLVAKVQRMMEEELVRVSKVAVERGVAVEGKGVNSVKDAIQQ
ncbi:1-acyl-sn-glycerol-3-phosphate-acyltransferas-like protein [Elsinoe ampelina]|uniref:1-acyl-sn-glycerol-3-phosphate acyltransferase n=1 Tax=Elsinoe ampelina TaxID=302913 RepID=A0A6A6GAM9_9PEZI|nr:1-acyl-sn-glycerol-3-phosphate-acyltransferas-like protein [Elsinoe ampelina]